MNRKKNAAVLLGICLLFLLSACPNNQTGMPGGDNNDDGTEENGGDGPGDDSGEGEADPCDCEANTPAYDPALDPNNVYLDLCVAADWNPGQVGENRKGWGSGTVADASGVPVQNNEALGPPEGTGSYSSSDKYTCIGINGSAVWRFNEDYYIFDGPGNDFVTFTSTFAWSGACDGLCCELAHVEVSEDGSVWYEHSGEDYVENPDPSADNPDYRYFSVENLHGNNPTWANHTLNKQAQEIRDVDGEFRWVDIDCTCVSRYFAPGDPYLGGVEFDLDDFTRKPDGETWPAGGKMRYIKLIDDDTILDGQDYLKSWCLGANLMSAMGINVAAF